MLRPSILSCFTVLALFTAVTGQTASAAERALRTNTPSGLPVPRFVSLKSAETSCRAGPSFDHPVRLTYKRRALPVLIIAETTDHWRKIEDRDGDQCWIHKSKLSGAKTVIAIGAATPLRAKPAMIAPLRATLEAGVIARIDKSEKGWLRVDADGLKGWARADAFWGAYTPADFVALQN